MSLSVEIEYCKNCHLHSWCSRHDEFKYIDFFQQLGLRINNELPDVQVSQRKVPDQYELKRSLVKQYNEYVDSNTGDTVLFPRSGAFQIYADGYRIFSKINSKRWPKFDKIIQIFKKMIKTKNQDGNLAIFDVDYQQQLNDKPLRNADLYDIKNIFRVRKQKNEMGAISRSIDARKQYRDKNLLKTLDLTPYQRNNPEIRYFQEQDHLQTQKFLNRWNLKPKSKTKQRNVYLEQVLPRAGIANQKKRRRLLLLNDLEQQKIIIENDNGEKQIYRREILNEQRPGVSRNNRRKLVPLNEPLIKNNTGRHSQHLHKSNNIKYQNVPGFKLRANKNGNNNQQQIKDRSLKDNNKQIKKTQEEKKEEENLEYGEEQFEEVNGNNNNKQFDKLELQEDNKSVRDDKQQKQSHKAMDNELKIEQKSDKESVHLIKQNSSQNKNYDEFNKQSEQLKNPSEEAQDIEENDSRQFIIDIEEQGKVNNQQIQNNGQQIQNNDQQIQNNDQQIQNNQLQKTNNDLLFQQKLEIDYIWNAKYINKQFHLVSCNQSQFEQIQEPIEQAGNSKLSQNKDNIKSQEPINDKIGNTDEIIINDDINVLQNKQGNKNVDEIVKEDSQMIPEVNGKNQKHQNKLSLANQGNANIVKEQPLIAQKQDRQQKDQWVNKKQIQQLSEYSVIEWQTKIEGQFTFIYNKNQKIDEKVNNQKQELEKDQQNQQKSELQKKDENKDDCRWDAIYDHNSYQLVKVLPVS